MGNNKKKNRKKDKKGVRTPHTAFPVRGDIAGVAVVQGPHNDEMDVIEAMAYTTPMVERPIPTMTYAVDQCRPKCNAVPASERTETCKRFVRAFQLQDEICASIAHLTVEEVAIQRKGVTLQDLVADDSYVKNCSKYILCNELTNSRIGFVGNDIVKLSRPEVAAKIPTLHPISEPIVQLARLGAKEFVVLLANAMYLQMRKQDAASLIVVHELYAQLIHGENKWLHFSEQLDDTTSSLTGLDCKFAMATVGVKSARAMYRNRDQRQPSPWLKKTTSSAFLLDSMEIFANMLVKLRPESPMGYWNLGYLAHESVAKRNWHGLRGAAECLIQMKKCMEAADAIDDDFMKAAARIEAALCLCLGGEGMVGYTLQVGGVKSSTQVRRKFHIPIEEQLADPHFHFQTYAEDPRVQEATIRKETERMKRAVPQTTLEPGETVLVPRWTVLRFWNEAMEAYDSLETWGHHFFVYGEVMGWDSVSNYLHSTAHYEQGRYGECLNDGQGFPGDRDRGFETSLCYVCRKSETDDEGCKLQKCARCKQVTYCSRECQLKDWESGHKKLCKSLAKDKGRHM